MKRRVIVALLAAVPPVLITWGSARLADTAARSFARGLEQAAVWVHPSSNNSGDAELAKRAEPTAIAAPVATPPPVSPRTTSSRAERPAGRKPVEPPRHGLRVSAATVLQLANGGARPSGVFVAANGVRPAGLALSGVSALGVGLRDGDVLTHAGGRPALSRGDVIGVVIASRGAGAREISGRFWRDGEPWNLIVEQPYVARSARAATAATDRIERPASVLCIASR